MKMMQTKIKELDDHALVKSFEEIQAFRQSNLLADGIVRQLHQDCELHVGYELDVRKTEELFLLEMAFRFTKRVQ